MLEETRELREQIRVIREIMQREINGLHEVMDAVRADWINIRAVHKGIILDPLNNTRTQYEETAVVR